MNKTNIQDIPISQILNDIPVASDFFIAYNIDVKNEVRTFKELVSSFDDDFWEDNNTNAQELTTLYCEFIDALNVSSETVKIDTLEVKAGLDKNKTLEACDLHLKAGEITCIVGPTGSGKSRLLADIEWLANGDTPTKRQVLINGEAADGAMLSQYGGKLIAQITQNMNFVLDMDVYSFLILHAQSRFLPEAEARVEEVIALANELSGEEFEKDTPVTCLSGGQSRALMIADVACIGQAPIVLIDEIENAGVNKKRALDLLVSKDKIVLMATHDPLLILLADKRVVIKNGGMHKIIKTNAAEKAFYSKLELLDNTLQQTKDYFRAGNEILVGDEITINTP